MSDRCPSPEALAEAYAGAGALSVHQHVDRCTACAEQWHGFEELSKLAQALPRASRSAGEVEEIRTVLLTSALNERGPRPAGLSRRTKLVRWAAGPLAVAASLLVVLALQSGTPADTEVHRGRVQAASGARLTHSRTVLADGSADEVVRLIDGRVRVAVDPLHAGERFRVLVGNAEIEVRGTEFDVAAEQDVLTSVLVHHGRVVVRPRGGVETSLSNGQRWAPVPIVSVAPPEPEATTPAQAVVAARPVESKPVARAARVAAAPPVAAEAEVPPLPLPARAGLLGGATEEAFAEGWQALRAGNADAAALSFARAAESAPQTALAEDSRFWEAVALARAGKTAAASRAMAGFLDSYPASPRAGELSAMLGWLLLDQGRVAEAKDRFVSALADPSDKVRQSAESGLLEVDAR